MTKKVDTHESETAEPVDQEKNALGQNKNDNYTEPKAKIAPPLGASLMRYLGLTAYSVVLIALTVTITAKQTRSIVNSNLYDYHLEYASKEKLMIVDMNQTIEKFTEQGASTREVIEATNGLLAMMANEGYVVLDSKLVLSSSSDYVLGDIKYKDILTYAEAEGIDVSEGVNDVLEAAENVKKMLLMMNNVN